MCPRDTSAAACTATRSAAKWSCADTIDPAVGWLIDFADLKRAVDPIVARLDHYLLNEIEGLENPTSELLAIWIWNQLAPQIPQLHRITIEETCSSRCHYYGSGTLN